MRKFLIGVLLAIMCLMVPAQSLADTYELATSADDLMSAYVDGVPSATNPATTNLTFGRMQIGSDYQFWTYYRYALPISRASKITSAKLHFLANQDGAGVFNTSIRGLAKDNKWEVGGFTAANYTDASDTLAIGTIGAPVTWSNVAAWTDTNWYYSPELATILQTQIDSADYDPSHGEDKYVGFAIDDGDGAFGATQYARRTDSWDTTPGDAVELVVTYTLPIRQLIMIRR